MAKKRETETAPVQVATKADKPFACKLAGRLGLGVGVVQQVLAICTPENVKALREAFEAGSDLLAELFGGLRQSSKPKPTPEANEKE